MRSWINQIWRGEWGVYFRFISTLLLIVCGVFTYFSITGCGEGGGGGGGGCGSSSSSVPVTTNASETTQPSDSTQSPYKMSVASSSSKALGGSSGYLSETVLPGSEITRYISYTTEEGMDPTQIAWTPPEGASNFNFYSNPPTNPSGPAPYIFDNNPPLTLPLHISYIAPQLPAYTNTLVVGEVYVASRAENTDDIRALNYTISSTASRSQMPSSAAASQPAAGGSKAADFSPLDVSRWVGANGITMTTSLCQQTYDWLQSDDTFIAMRMPVATGGGADLSYELPVVFSADSIPSEDWIGGRPKIGLNVSGVPDLPLEVRADRISFMENYLPSAAGEHWVALGVAQEPQITCPAAISQKSWEFNYVFPVNPAVDIDSLPLYYCQEGNDAPPIGNQALKLLARQPDGKAAPSTQVEGITCLGPQEHNLDMNPVIHVGNPGTAWNAHPLDEIRLMHYVEIFGAAPSINFSIDSGLAGAGWKLYAGNPVEPDLNTEVNINNPYTTTSNLMFLWLVGVVPTGAASGSYDVTLRVEKSDDAATYGSSNDIIWVGQWLTPAPPGGQPDDDKKIFLPMIRNK